jgi:hypothetical protein
MAKVIIKDCTNYDLYLIKKQINDGIELLGGWNKYISSGMKNKKEVKSYEYQNSICYKNQEFKENR